MNRVLYLEGSSGISGDMTVSALLDLGVSAQRLEEELGKLPLDGYRLVIGRTSKNGIDACAFYVELDGEKPQPLRNYREIREMLTASSLEEKVKMLAIHIFTVLAKAEAKVHGTTVEQVHFHEVGAVDSIVDIVAAAICFVELKIDQVAVGTLTEGTGTTWCQHGRIPVPVPATAELIREYGLSVNLTQIQGEMITPTGAAIAAALRNREVPSQFTIEKIGIGSGEKDFPYANILRAMILKEKEERQVTVLETNVDDCTGEQLGYLQELLLENGALDVLYRPVFMKKSRPAYQLQTVCKPEDVQKTEELIFRETTTIGIRSYQADRTILERRIETIQTSCQEIRVKVCRFREETYYYPEYEDLKQYCQKSGTTFREAYEQIQKKSGAGEIKMQENRKIELLEQLRAETKENVCLALSGGVDSALLAALIGKCAKENGTKAYGVTFDTVLHPAADLEAARQAAKDSGLVHKVITVNELEFEEIKDNPKNRCYICKNGMFQQLKTFASKHGMTVIYEGTNYDDLSQYRPGLKALQELGIKSPLLEHGFTKAEIRGWAKELGISAADRPSAPCMATRIPYGTKLDLLTLRKLEAAEEALRELGFSVVRVRLHGDVVRLELPKEKLAEAVEKNQMIIRLLKAMEFKYITLDIEGFRSGSMDL